MKPVENKKKEGTISKISGRMIKRPKKIETTSSEEETRRKKKLKPDRETMKAEIARLRQFVGKEQETEKEKEKRVYSSPEEETNKQKDICSSPEEETNKQKDVRSSSEEETEEDYSLSEEEESTKETDIHSSSEEHFPITSKKLSKKNDNSPTAVQSPKNERRKQTFSNLPLHSNIKRNHAYPSESRCNCSETLERLKKFEDDTAKSFRKMIEANKKVLEAVKQMNDNKVEVGAHTFYQALKGFPIETVEQFHEFENDQSKKNEHDKLYHHLCGMGASKLRDFVHMCLRETMKDELVCQFTWPGGSGTEKFGDTKLVKIMYDAAQKCPLFEGPLNKTIFKSEVQEVLRTVKQRVKCRKKKNETSNKNERNSEEENDKGKTPNSRN